MLWTIFLILVVLWAFGLIGGYTFGGLIHLRDEVVAVLGAYLEPAFQRGAIDDRSGAARGLHRDVQHGVHEAF